MRVGRRRGCGINAIDRGHPRKFRAYGLVGWWNVLYISSFNASKPITFSDLFGGGRDATQATDANRGTYQATGWNNRPCVDFGADGLKGYTTANVTVGVQTMIAVVQGISNSQYCMTHNADDNYIFSNAGASIRANRGATSSQKAVSATWIRDSVKKQVARTFDGTNAGHLAYVNAVDQNATDIPTVGNPGTGTVNGPIGLGCVAGLTLGFRGLGCEWMMYSVPMTGPLSPLRRIFNRQRALWPMPG